MATRNLVIRRKINESFLIGGNVVVTLLRFRRDEVVLSIEAPSEIPVNRSEIAQRILESGKRLPALVCDPLSA